MKLTKMALLPYIDELSRASEQMDAPRYMSAWSHIEAMRSEAFCCRLHDFCAEIHDAIHGIRLPSKPDSPSLIAPYVDFIAQICNTFDMNDHRIDELVGINDEIDRLLAQKIDPLISTLPASLAKNLILSQPFTAKR